MSCLVGDSRRHNFSWRGSYFECWPNSVVTIRLGRVMRIWYLSPMPEAKVQASLRICTVSPEPPLLAHAGSESRRTFRQKARSLAPLNGWACAVRICHDGMLEDTNSLDAADLTDSKAVRLAVNPITSDS